MELIIKGIDFFFKFNLKKFRFPTIIVIVPVSFFTELIAGGKQGESLQSFARFVVSAVKKMKNESDLKHRFKKKRSMEGGRVGTWRWKD